MENNYNNILDKYALEKGASYSKKIDDGVYVFFIKPKWCPKILYRFIGKHFINITFINK